MKTIRKIPVSAATVNGSVFHYSVVVRNMFNCEGNVIGEVYGADVSGPDRSAAALDLTTRKDRIFDFVKTLSAYRVTPVSLRDVVYDSLPL